METATETRTYTFHTDPGHAWLAVPIRHLRESGVYSLISRYSYRQFGTAYLEEDCDAPKFLNALKAQGISVNFKEEYLNTDHWIRNLCRWVAL